MFCGRLCTSWDSKYHGVRLQYFRVSKISTSNDNTSILNFLINIAICIHYYYLLCTLLVSLSVQAVKINVNTCTSLRARGRCEDLWPPELPRKHMGALAANISHFQKVKIELSKHFWDLRSGCSVAQYARCWHGHSGVLGSSPDRVTVFHRSFSYVHIYKTLLPRIRWRNHFEKCVSHWTPVQANWRVGCYFPFTNF